MGIVEEAPQGGHEIWESFVAAFLAEVRSLSESDRMRFWETETSRTATYDALLPRVANKLGMDFKSEYMTVDGHLKLAGGRWNGFAQIWVEYENRIGGTEEEMDKLCYLRSPVKVLITVGTWPSEWKEKWRAYVRENNLWLPESPKAVYGFIVGEARRIDSDKECLHFHIFTLSPDGTETCQEKEELIGELV